MPVKRASKKVRKTSRRSSRRSSRKNMNGGAKRRSSKNRKTSRRKVMKGGKDGTLLVVDNKNTNNNIVLCDEDLDIAEKLKASGKYPQHLNTLNLIINLKAALRDQIYVSAPAETLTAIDNFQQNLSKLPGYPLVRKCALKKNQSGLKI